MPERKVLLITEVTPIWSTMDEFNLMWEENILPYWQENGATHIGSYTNYLGDGKNKTIRLFHFDSLADFDAFMETREAMFDTDAGRESLGALYPYMDTIRETVWKSATTAWPANCTSIPEKV